MSLSQTSAASACNRSNVLLNRVLDYIKTDSSDHTFAVFNPADESIVTHVTDMDARDADAAINAASIAQPLWAGLTAKERSDVLRRWYDLIISNEAELGEILTLEQGKPLAEARGEVTFGASYIEWFAEEAKRAYGDVIPTTTTSRRHIVIKQPVGVVAAITPWNFPSGMITRKAAPALAVGCTIVLKPSEETPLSALALQCLAIDAGFPDGVFQIITSSDPASIAEVFTNHTLVRKISFTGSTRVGKLLMGQSASTLKRLSLELGGNAPLIVFSDADVDAAVVGAMAAKFRNAGQTCVCANRILLHSSIADEFLTKFVNAAEKLNVADGFDPNSNMGPMINKKAKHKAQALVDDALSKGAVLRTSQKETSTSNFMAPIVLSDVTTDMDIAHTEIFGPVAPIFIFETDEEAISLANNTPYGLAAYFWTRELARAWHVAEQLQVGMVGINENAISSPGSPFGGVKESGLGREGSRYGLDDYLDIKSLAIGGL